MSRRTSPLIIVFTCIMLAFCAFLFWYVLTMNSLSFRLTDTRLSLETSQGRERKQQAEYNQVSLELPETRQALEALLPETEAAQAQVDALKAERKALREKKKALEEALPGSQPASVPEQPSESSDSQEGAAHE